MTEQHKEQAIQVLKEVLHVFHERRYEDLPACVSEIEREWSDLEMVREVMNGNLEVKELDSFDEYGVPCNFHPQYEYHQLRFYEYADGRGFSLDYEMTSGGELADLCLQMVFWYKEDGLHSIFACIDPM